MAEYPESMESVDSKSTNTLTIHDLINLVLSNWYWFLLSVILCGLVAVFYLSRTAPTYQRTATVLVKDSRKGSGTEVTAFNDIIGGLGRRSVDNEVHIFQSRRLMEQVVKKYDLTTRYLDKSGIRTIDMYGRAPVIIEFLTFGQSEGVSFKYDIVDDSTIRLSEFIMADPDRETEFEDVVITAALNDTVSTPAGDIIAITTPYFEKNKKLSIAVTRSPLNEVTEAYRRRLRCEISDKQASVITITMADQVPLRAENVINGIIDAYNIDAIEDKQAISNLTEEFINERLVTLGQELNLADSEIAAFKKENRLYSPEDEASLSAEELKRLKEDILSLEGNLEMAQFILNYLNDDSKTFSLIPASTVTMSGATQALSSQIDLYNRNVLDYTRLLSASSESNPIIIDLGNQIANLRSAVITSLESHIEGLKLQVEHIRKEQNLADKRMQSSPTKEMELLSKARQQKVKEELYIYLLTKLEENALLGATAESNARIIDRAYGSNRPISPRSAMILLVALVMGVAIPFAILYIREMMNTTVRSRRDLDDVLSIPYLGDIPKYDGRTDSGIVVREDSRDALSESFRMIRANLGFMSVDKTIQVIMFTSSIPHSGKTFVSSNLAMTLAASGKRVLIIDFDLRRRTLSKTMGHRNDRRGLTSYLMNKITSVDDIVTHSEIDENLDFIFAGPQPPNPAEMLMSQRVDSLIAELRKSYDYIILDSVPAMAVADAMIIDRLTDLTVYVIRQGNLDRRHLPDIEQLYREKKFHNMSIVLNDVTGGKHSYGYGYGYGYGYYSDSEKPSIIRGGWDRIKQIFKRSDR